MRSLKLVVLAGLIAAGCAPAKHANIAAATYLVTLDGRVSGTLTGFGTPVESGATILWQGTAVAVSADGDLLTVRHVVDAAYGAHELCHRVLVDWENFAILRDARLETLRLTVSGPGLRHWSGAAVAAPGGPCDINGVLRLAWSPDSQVTIAAVDSRADLALLDVKAEGLPFLTLDRTPPVPATPVVAMGPPGFLSSGEFMEGIVVRPCIMLAPKPDIPPMPVIQVSQYFNKGMSGGPLVAAGKLVGINSMVLAQGGPRSSFAIAGPYVAAWYDWTRKVAPKGPQTVCP